jgi:hypothetical protein
MGRQRTAKASCFNPFVTIYIIDSLQKVETRPKNVHSSNAIPMKKYPCPLAKKEKCNKTFTSAQSAKNHTKVHSSERICRPLANETGCLKTFKWTEAAKHHADTIHKKIMYPCPLANELGCKREFRLKSKAEEHTKTQHEGQRISCPNAKELGCNKTFSTDQIMKKHVGDVHSLIFMTS